MQSSPNAELIAPCGMNCALCASYLAQKNGIRGKGIRMPYCAGCRPRGKICAFIKKRCAKLLNGEVQFCFECKDFPCHSLRTIDARYKSRYRMSMIENLEFMKTKGVGKFLEAQAEKWRCPQCGGFICCHNGLCFSCDLEKLKGRKQMYRWEDTAPEKV